MEVSKRQGLSFVALDRRLRDMPEGPAEILNTPRLLKTLNVLAGVGALMGVIPYVLIQWLEPMEWMVCLAKAGLVVLCAAALPGVFRNLGVMGLSFWHRRDDQVTQLDHDRVYFAYILDWLTGFPATELEDNKRIVRVRREQLTAKLGLLAGGLDKLGLLPVFVSVFLFIRQWTDLLAMPSWQVVLAAFLALLYLLVTTANLMRIRLQLYEALLQEALARK